MATSLGERAFAEHVKSKLDATFQKINDGAPGVSGLAKFTKVSVCLSQYSSERTSMFVSTKAWMYGREFLYPRDIRTQERKELGAPGHTGLLTRDIAEFCQRSGDI